MDNSIDEEAARLRKNYIEIEKKRNKFKFSIPDKIKYPLLWTVFFSIIGVAQESIINKALILSNFFTSRYIAWFSAFGNFAEVYNTLGVNELIMTILRTWYYFFITGGIISLLWGILYTIIHAEVKVKRDDFHPKAI